MRTSSHVREENGTNIQMGCANCASAVERWPSNCWTEDPTAENWASGHHWASAELCVTPPNSSGNRANNACFQLGQDVSTFELHTGAGGRALVGDATKVVSIHLRKGVRMLSFYDAL